MTDDDGLEPVPGRIPCGHRGCRVCWRRKRSIDEIIKESRRRASEVWDAVKRRRK